MVLSQVVAIDGPSGSGKSTVAKLIAKKLGLLYVDTGAMFRAVAAYFIQHQWPIEDDLFLQEKLGDLNFKYGESQESLVAINGHNLTKAIREHHVSEAASKMSKLPSLRQYLLKVQRDLAKEKVCVMEGRDIGTVVFPTSFCKIFLTAELEVRAERRYKELLGRGEKGLSLEQIVADVRVRDERDMNREEAPLKAATDALVFDTSDLTLEEVTQKLCEHVKEMAKKAAIAIKSESGN